MKYQLQLILLEVEDLDFTPIDYNIIQVQGDVRTTIYTGGNYDFEEMNTSSARTWRTQIELLPISEHSVKMIVDELNLKKPSEV